MDFITKPFGWLMMMLYEFAKNYGIAVILFAFIIKVILLPFMMKSKRNTMRSGRLAPKIKELEKKHGANKQQYQVELSKLYKEENFNPASGCLWSLIPFPIMLALYGAIRQPLTIMMGVAQQAIAKDGVIYNLLPSSLQAASTYSQIHQAEYISQHFSVFQGIANLRQIDYSFLGMNLGNTPQPDFLWKTNWSDPSIWVPGLLLFLLPIVSGLLAYFSSKISMKVNPTVGSQQQSMSKSMLLLMPLMSVYFAFIMPAAIGVYIIVSTLLQVVQDVILTKHYTGILDAEDVVKNEARRIKEAEIEAKRLETERKRIENNMERNPNTSKKKQLKTERQEQIVKTVEWEKKHAPAPRAEDPSRSGTRRYARGRAYDPERFGADNQSAQTDDVRALNPSSQESKQASQEDYDFDPDQSFMTFKDAEDEQDETGSDEEE